METTEAQRLATADTLRRWAAQCENTWGGWRLAALAVDGPDLDPDAAAWADVFCRRNRLASASNTHFAGDAALALCFAASACEAGEPIWEPF